MSVTRLDYCQYLLVRRINYTLTKFADHSEISHDAVNRYLVGDKLTPRLVWENVKRQLETSPKGYVLFDDTVIDKQPITRSEGAVNVGCRPLRRRSVLEPFTPSGSTSRTPKRFSSSWQLLRYRFAAYTTP